MKVLRFDTPDAPKPIELSIAQVGELITDYIELAITHDSWSIPASRIRRMLAATDLLQYALMRELFHEGAQTRKFHYEPSAPEAGTPAEEPAVIYARLMETSQTYTVRDADPPARRQRRFGSDPGITGGDLSDQCLRRSCHDLVARARSTAAENPTANKAELIERIFGQPAVPNMYARLKQVLQHRCYMPPVRDAKGRVLPST